MKPSPVTPQFFLSETSKISLQDGPISHTVFKGFKTYAEMNMINWSLLSAHKTLEGCPLNS